MNIAHSVPTDIHVGIIDQCQDDPRLLSTCALVCRDWRKRSQFQIFRVVTIRTRRHVYSLRDVLIPNLELASLVHTVSIQPSPPEHRFRIPSLFDTAAMELLPFLVNLRTWRFSSDLDEGDPSGHPLFLTRTAFHLFQRTHERSGRDVATLELHRLTFTSYPELVRTVRKLPQLQHLWCSEIKFKLPVDGSLDVSTLGKLPLLSLDVSYMDEKASFMLLDLARESIDDSTDVSVEWDGCSTAAMPLLLLGLLAKLSPWLTNPDCKSKCPRTNPLAPLFLPLSENEAMDHVLEMGRRYRFPQRFPPPEGKKSCPPHFYCGDNNSGSNDRWQISMTAVRPGNCDSGVMTAEDAAQMQCIASYLDLFDDPAFKKFVSRVVPYMRFDGQVAGDLQYSDLTHSLDEGRLRLLASIVKLVTFFQVQLNPPPPPPPHRRAVMLAAILMLVLIWILYRILVFTSISPTLQAIEDMTLIL